MADTSIYAGRTFQSVRGQIQVPTLAGGMADINAIIAGSVSRDPWTYYDTLLLDQGITLQPEYNLFQNAIGQADQYSPYTPAEVKTRVLTNMPQPASQGFSSPRDLIMDTLSFYFRAGGVGTNGNAPVNGAFANVLDMLTVCQFSYFQFRIIDKVFYEGYLELKPSGNGFYGVSTVGSQQVFTLGMVNPHAKDRVSANYAKYLATLMPWSLTLYFPSNNGPGNGGNTANVAPTLLTSANGGHGLCLLANLQGLTDRAIQ